MFNDVMSYPISLITLILSLLLARVVLAEDADPDAPHVCIIGAGIAAASTAHFLSQVPLPPRITVFERTHRVGGRVRTFQASESSSYEAGASIIANANEMMGYFRIHLGLKPEPKPSLSMGFWNGTAFVFRTSSTSTRTIFSIFRRYRLSPLLIRSFVQRLVQSYAKLYPESFHIAHLRAFSSVRDLLSRADQLYAMSQSAFPKYLEAHASPLYIAEMASAIVRVNYNQDLSRMNALSGSVGLAGSGGVWSVNGGNEKVISGLLADSKARIVLNTSVDELSKETPPSGHTRYKLSTTTSTCAPDDPAEAPTANDDATQTAGQTECDAVVLAAPFELARLAVPSELHDRMHVDRSFQTTFATFVRASLNIAVFGEDPPRSVLTTGAAGPDSVFTSMGCVKLGANGEPSLWKVFSRARLTPEALGYLFEPGAKVVRAFPWHAYPRFNPPERFADFDVDKGGALFYTSPLESAGSAMEMSALAGANAAALVRDRLGLLDTSFEEEEAIKQDL